MTSGLQYQFRDAIASKEFHRKAQESCNTFLNIAFAPLMELVCQAEISPELGCIYHAKNSVILLLKAKNFACLKLAQSHCQSLQHGAARLQIINIGFELSIYSNLFGIKNN